MNTEREIWVCAPLRAVWVEERWMLGPFGFAALQDHYRRDGVGLSSMNSLAGRLVSLSRKLARGRRSHSVFLFALPTAGGADIQFPGKFACLGLLLEPTQLQPATGKFSCRVEPVSGNIDLP